MYIHFILFSFILVFSGRWKTAPRTVQRIINCLWQKAGLRNIKADLMRLFLTVVYFHIRVNRILSGRWRRMAVIFTLRNSISCCNLNVISDHILNAISKRLMFSIRDTWSCRSFCGENGGTNRQSKLNLYQVVSC